MTANSSRKALRRVFEGDACIHPGSVYDPISARIAEDMGFEAGMLAGSVASFAVLGAPDIIVLTLSEFADLARRICRASALPIIVDADHGYGNAMNVKRTAEELQNAGISALTIEDTVLPKPFDSKGTTLLPVEEGVGKMRAALAGRTDPNMIVLGRTSAVGINGVDDGIARAKAYMDAGVDGIMFVGTKTREEIDKIGRELDAPVMLGGVPRELSDRNYLASCGVRVCLQGHHPFWAGVQAVHDTLRALRDGTHSSELQGVASAELQKRVTRDADYNAWMEDFLS